MNRERDQKTDRKISMIRRSMAKQIQFTVFKTFLLVDIDQSYTLFTTTDIPRRSQSPLTPVPDIDNIPPPPEAPRYPQRDHQPPDR